MATYATPMDKLEAVNILLSSIGEPSINSLEGAGLDAQIADALVNETSRSAQGRGWHWNRETHKLSPNVDGNILLPENTASVDSFRSSFNVDVVQRGLKLFNRGTNSYEFDVPVEVDLVVVLPFDDLPLACKDYIAASSAMIFQQRVLGSETLDKFLSLKAKSAWAELIRAEIKSADPNMLRDNWSSQGIIQRGSFRRSEY